MKNKQNRNTEKKENEYKMENLDLLRTVNSVFENICYKARLINKFEVK